MKGTKWSSVGVSMVHKLRIKHIKLTGYSKMKVDLAAQVMQKVCMVQSLL